MSQERQHFAELVVDAVSYLDEDLPINMIGIKKVSGGSLSVRFYIFFKKSILRKIFLLVVANIYINKIKMGFRK